MLHFTSIAKHVDSFPEIQSYFLSLKTQKSFQIKQVVKNLQITYTANSSHTLETPSSHLLDIKIANSALGVLHVIIVFRVSDTLDVFHWLFKSSKMIQISTDFYKPDRIFCYSQSLPLYETQWGANSKDKIKTYMNIVCPINDYKWLPSCY